MNTYNVIGASTEQAVYRRKGKDGGNYDTLDLLRKNNLCSCVVHDGSGSCALLASCFRSCFCGGFGNSLCLGSQCAAAEKAGCQYGYRQYAGKNFLNFSDSHLVFLSFV